MFLNKNSNDNEVLGSVNERRLAAVYINSTTSGLEIIHGILDLIFMKLYKGKKNYELKDGNKPYFLHKL